MQSHDSKQVHFTALLVVLLVSLVSCATSTPTSKPQDPLALPVEESTCLPVTAYKFVGPALDISQVEAISLRKMKASRDAPQIPFGYKNAKWLALKAGLKPGDTIHSFETDTTGGYLVQRDLCVVGQMTSWIR